MSLKIVETSKGILIPIWLEEGNTPRGCMTVSQARAYLKHNGYNKPDPLMMARELPGNPDRIRLTTLPTRHKKVLVRCTNKEVAPPSRGEGPHSPGSFFWQILTDLQQGASERTIKMLGDATTMVANCKLGRREGGGRATCFVVLAPSAFATLWESAPTRIKVYAGHTAVSNLKKPIVVYMAKDDTGTGMRQWPLDMRWEVPPVNGKRVFADGNELASQFLFNLLALETLSRTTVFDESLNWETPVLAMAPKSYYCSAVFGPGNHKPILEAYAQLSELLYRFTNRASDDPGNTQLRYELSTLFMITREWSSGGKHSQMDRFFEPAVSNPEGFEELLSLTGLTAVQSS